MKHPATIRRHFIAKFMGDVGLTYQQACCTYVSMVSLIEDSVLNGTRVNIGRVGAITPVTRPARNVNMGFQRVQGGKIERVKRVFHLDERLDWKFNLFREFKQRHRLRNG